VNIVDWLYRFDERSNVGKTTFDLLDIEPLSLVRLGERSRHAINNMFGYRDIEHTVFPQGNDLRGGRWNR
jgi:hypothetical protein